MTNIQITEFITYCKEQLGLSEHSLRAYSQDLRTFQNFMRSKKITDLPSQKEIIEYQRFLREERLASPATIRRRIVTIKSYYTWLEVEDASVVSPFLGLRLELKIPKTLPRPVDRLTLVELFRKSRPIIDLSLEPTLSSTATFSTGQTTGLVARLLVVTGLRIGELTQLNVGDISAGASRIRVRGKGNRGRMVYVTNEKLLLDFRYYWEWRYRNVGAPGCLFVNAKGIRLSAAAYRKRLRTISKSLLIDPHLTPHQFRHSAATLLIEEGVDIRLIQRLLGHASIATTEIYTKVSDTSLVDAVSRADTLAQIDTNF